MMKRPHRLSIALAAGLAATFAPVTSSASADAPVTVPDASVACSALAGTAVDVEQIGLETEGAAVDAAVLTPADPVIGRGQVCSLTVRISPVDDSAPDINVAVNLPTQWNGRSMHFGAEGFDPVVVDGLGPLPGSGGASSPLPPARPIDRGYVTFGSDSGSAGWTGPAGSFGLNDEALANYAGEAVKKTRDTAMALVEEYYGQLPAHELFAGAAKGGHEALVAAQRYGADYDGIIAYYPAVQGPATPISRHAVVQAWNAPGGALNSAEQTLLYNSAMGVCDGLDGVSDGVIADVSGCDATFNLEILRCPEGADVGDWCLSTAQIETVQAATTPLPLDYELAGGVTSTEPYPVLQGAGLDTATINSYAHVAGSWWRYLVARDPALEPATFDYLAWESRIKELSSLYDATDPNIDQFRQDGGKLIVVQGSTDNLVAPATTSWYVDRLAGRYGEELPSFARYYVQPGYGHGDGAFNLSWDSLTALEAWLLDGTAPQNQVATDANPASLGRQMPLCDYPAWPQYTLGDPTLASSYTCVG